MITDKIILGKVKEDYKKYQVAGEIIYLSKHSWDCGWYWGFGYIGNERLHTHFDSEFLGEETDIRNIFETTDIRQDEWWILRDLFVQAYSLRKCAETYRHGGHQTTTKGITDIIQSKVMEKKINADLKIVLDKIWSILESIQTRNKIVEILNQKT